MPTLVPRTDDGQTNGEERQCRIHDHNSTMLGLGTSFKMMMMVVGVLNFALPESGPPDGG